MPVEFYRPFRVIKGALVQWWDDWNSWLVLILVWLLCWFTIVFGPPATFGIYFLANRAVQGHAPDLRGLGEALRRYFVRSWAWVLTNLAVMVIFLVNVLFYGHMQQVWAFFLRGLFTFFGFAWLGIQLYALPFIMLQEKDSLLLAWKNGVYTAVASPGFAALIWLVSFLIIALCFLTLIPFMLGLPGLIAVIGVHAVNERLVAFKILTTPEDDQSGS
jgi:hypothetical protein